MVSEKPHVVIILVNYNGTDDTHECIASLLENTYPNYSIVVVDNNSREEQVNKLKSDSFINSNSTVIYESENSGFSEGNNVGIRYAKEQGADYVLLLNNDTVVTPDFLDQLVDCAMKHERSIVTGSIKFFSDKDNYWYAGGDYDYNTGVTSMNYHINEIDKDELKVTFATGCLMLIPMNYIDSYGMLSDRFFLYSEDTEYCLRAIKNGYDIYWKPACLIYHKVNASTGKNSPLQQYYLTRNDLIIARDYSNNKSKSIGRIRFYCFKRIVKRDYQLQPVRDAFRDFKQGITGRSSKY